MKRFYPVYTTVEYAAELAFRAGVCGKTKHDSGGWTGSWKYVLAWTQATWYTQSVWTILTLFRLILDGRQSVLLAVQHGTAFADKLAGIGERRTCL